LCKERGAVPREKFEGETVQPEVKTNEADGPVRGGIVHDSSFDFPSQGPSQAAIFRSLRLAGWQARKFSPKKSAGRQTPQRTHNQVTCEHARGLMELQGSDSIKPNKGNVVL